MTPEEADKAYEDAPSEGISYEEMERMVENAARHKWRPWDDECCECGCSVNVYTVLDAGAYDGDSVKCPECGQTGYISADEDGCETVWHECSCPIIDGIAVTGSSCPIHGFPACSLEA